MKTQIYTGQDAVSFLETNREEIQNLPFSPDLEIAGLPISQAIDNELAFGDIVLIATQIHQRRIQGVYSAVIDNDPYTESATQLVGRVEFLQNDSYHTRLNLTQALVNFGAKKGQLLLNLPCFVEDETKLNLLSALELDEYWMTSGQIRSSSANDGMIGVGKRILSRRPQVVLHIDDDEKAIAASILSGAATDSLGVVYNETLHLFLDNPQSDLSNRLIQECRLMHGQYFEADKYGFVVSPGVDLNRITQVITALTEVQPEYVGRRLLDYILIRE